MSTLAVDRKKQIEKLYVEEARRATSIFPRGKLVAHEKPDFLVSIKKGTVGIEVTELCRESPRREAARLVKIPGAAKALYNGLPGSRPINVSLAFSRRAIHLHPKQLANSLADFVWAHREARLGAVGQSGGSEHMSPTPNYTRTLCCSQLDLWTVNTQSCSGCR